MPPTTEHVKNDEATWFTFSATLRVMDAAERHAEIQRVTGIEASHAHLRGETAHEKTARRWTNDIWQLSSPLPNEEELSKHLRWLWATVKPHQEYFKHLVEAGVRVDVFCGYRSNCAYAGFGLEPGAVEIAHELGIGLEFSVIISPA